jgi:hypothetical protein
MISYLKIMRKTRLHKGRLTANDSSVNVIFTINGANFYIKTAGLVVLPPQISVLLISPFNQLAAGSFSFTFTFTFSFSLLGSNRSRQSLQRDRHDTDTKTCQRQHCSYGMPVHR